MINNSNLKNNVDYKNFSNQKLKELSEQWYNEAVVFENRLDKLIINVGDTTDILVKNKIERLWSIANQLWRRIAALEKFRVKKNLNVVKLKT